MKLNKEIVIILILASLLFSALGTAFYFYTQGKKALISGNTLKIVYIAAKNIEKNKKITKKDLKATKIAQKFIVTKPLLANNIIGKFAVEKIYKGDTFTKEKLVKYLQKNKENKKIKKDTFKFTSYNMAFKMFRNPNYSLNVGDTIDIISVYKTEKKRPNGSSNKVQYIAKNNKVLDFISDGKKTDKTMKKVKRTRVVGKKSVTENVIVKAEEILLDIKKDALLHIIDDYNRGGQLWMVQTKEVVNQYKKVIKISHINKKRTYPSILYKPRKVGKNIQATIHYADQESASITKHKILQLNYTDQCLKSKKFLLGIANKVYLRTGPTLRYKIIRIVHRNYIIPYTSKIDTNWYRTCDGYYVHKSEAEEITKKQAMTQLGRLK